MSRPTPDERLMAELAWRAVRDEVPTEAAAGQLRMALREDGRTDVADLDPRVPSTSEGEGT